MRSYISQHFAADYFISDVRLVDAGEQEMHFDIREFVTRRKKRAVLMRESLITRTPSSLCASLAVI